MNAERFQRAMELFQKLCDVPSDQRSTALDSACAGDAGLRAEVEALLEHDLDGTRRIRVDELGGAPLRLAAEVVGDSPGAEDQDAPLPGYIGRYRVVRRIGEGGMGTVYEAEQEAPRRTVAIKVLRSGAATASLQRRFEHEAFILGRLQHPGIAQIIEAGRAPGPAGEQLFLVMELIHGQDIIAYANKHDLDHRQRLALFIRVCEAVQHAHQKGVIHRDLKPANILVAEEASSANTVSDSRLVAPGQPKILDFGVARLTDSDLNVTTMQTGMGQLIGTIPYMSPEQVSGEGADVDTRSDVYCLGVVVHELLTGNLPHDVRNRSILEAARIIRSEPPRRLSTISRRFRGDLETILMKALEKDKERRYQSAAELAADVRAYLANEPIAAKRDSRWYVLQKVAWRYKLATGFAAALLVLISGSAIGLGILYQRATESARIATSERDRATEAESAARGEARRMERASGFLRSIIQAADSRALGRDVKVVDALDYAAKKVYTDFGDDPETRAGVLVSISQTYQDLGMYSQSAQAIEDAIKIHREFEPQGSAVMAGALNQQGGVFSSLGKLPEAVRAFEEALALHRTHGKDDWNVTYLNNLGNIHQRMGKLEAAEKCLLEVLAICRARGTSADAQQWPELASALAGHAALLYAQRKFDESALAASEAIEIYRKHGSRMEGQGRAQFAAVLNNMGAIEIERGNFDATRKYYQESLDLIRALRGPEHPEVSNALVNIATFERNHGDMQRAEELYRAALALRRKFLPPGHPDLGHPLTGLGTLLTKSGRELEAEPLLREAYKLRKEANVPGASLALTAAALGTCLFLQGEHDQAAPLLLEGFELHTKFRGPTHAQTLEAARYLQDLFRATGQTDRLAAFQAASQPVAAIPNPNPPR